MASIRILWQCRRCRKMVDAVLSHCPHCGAVRRPFIGNVEGKTAA